MKSRIANQSLLLILVVQVSRTCMSLMLPSIAATARAEHDFGTPAAAHVPRTLKCSSHCFPHPHWLCPSSTAGSSQACLSSSTPLPPAMLARQPPGAFVTQTHTDRSPRSCSTPGGQLFPFGWGRISLGVPLFNEKVWTPMSIQCLMGLESSALGRWRESFLQEHVVTE